MGVETATKISQLNATWPPGTDNKSEGDNHLRLIKSVLQSSFDDSGSTIKTTLPIEVPGGKLTGDLDMNSYKILNVLQLLLKDATGLADFMNSEVRNAKALWQRGFLFGLTTTPGANTIDVAVGTAATDDAIPVLMTLAAPISKNVNAVWAVGNGAGGCLDGAGLANGTGHIYLIQRPDTGVVDVAVSASLTPVLPTNYTRKRRIFSFTRVAAANTLYTQVGDLAMLQQVVADLTVNNPGTAAVLRTLNVPSGIPIEAIFNWRAGNSGAVNTYGIGFSSPLLPAPVSTGHYQVISVWNGAGAVASIGGEMRIKTATAQIRTISNYSDAVCSLSMYTVGWTDTRGRL